MDERPLPPEFEFVRVGRRRVRRSRVGPPASLDRPVAVKRIHRHGLSDDDALVRFRREAQVLAGCTTPRRAGVRLVKNVPDALLVMEFARRRPVRRPLGRMLSAVRAWSSFVTSPAPSPRRPRPASYIGTSNPPTCSCWTMAAPSSATSGWPRCCRPVGVPDRRRSAGGTPAYFPPEMSQGLAEPDQRSDAYSFAVMAYEVSAGRLPIPAEKPMAMIAAHWVQPVPRPEASVPGFPIEAADALVQGLDKHPEARLLPAELMARLHRVPESAWPAARAPRPDPAVPFDPTRIASTPMFAPAPSRSANASPGPRRRWSWRVLAPSALLVCAAGITGTVLALSSSSDPPPQRIAVSDVIVHVTPSSGRGRCPSAQFDFVGRIVTNGAAGQVTTSWLLPGGQRVAAQQVDVAAGRRAARVGVHFRVTGQRSLHGHATLQVEAGTVHAARSSEIHYSC